MFISSVRGFDLKRLSNVRGLSNVKRSMGLQNKVDHPSYFLRPTKYLQREYIDNKKIPSSSNLALIILNRKIDNPSLVCHLWKQASMKICADGGANKLYEAHESDVTRAQYVPNCVVGDLDSARSDVLDFYKSLGAEIIQDTDQYQTDCDKAMREVHNVIGEKQDTTIIAMGGIGGRFDHEMAALHSLFKCSDIFPDMVVMGEGNTATLLRPGRNIIHCDKVFDGPICGLLPIGGPCKVITKGLKWNLFNEKLAFGELISSCNIIVSEKQDVQLSGGSHNRCPFGLEHATTVWEILMSRYCADIDVA